MRKLSLLFIALSFFFYNLLAVPHLAEAAKKTHQKKTEKTISKKTGKTASKTGRMSQAAIDEERDLWMERAKNSETLTGKASWYGKDFHNKATASGLPYDMHTFTAAHRTLPLGTIVKVTDQNNGKSVMVCVTDRGPYVKDRIIDLSYAAASQLGLEDRGVGNVKLEVVGEANTAPLKKGQAYFVEYASGAGKSKAGPFHAFVDAAAMQEALRQAHPEARVILAKDVKP